ncbi:DExH-box ATP-dependent RNA helicase DExH6, partial [Dissostichus eleginoides]
SPWHKMICHSEQESALQGGRWHQFISTGLIQNIVSPSGRKQIKQTRGQMESKEEKGGRIENKEEK